MLQTAKRATAAKYVKRYASFKGVDMSSAVTEVDESRSPDAPNMIADSEGFPQKRTGFKIMWSFPGKINGIYSLVIGGVRQFVIHAGTKLYKNDGTKNYDSADMLLYEGLNDNVSTGFVTGEKLYILDGSNYVVFDGETVKNVEEEGYVPTTMIAAPPTGGGEDFEPVNLLSSSRINRFQGTAGTTTYQLDAEGIDSVTKIEKLNSSGVWEDVSNSSYTVNTATGQITFTTAPGVPPVTGEDNIRITFEKTVDGYADRIKKCTVATFYGYNNDTRVFLTGNPDYKNYDWYSYGAFEPNPAYFPDNNYSVIGNDNSAVMGYLRQYDYLAIVKEYNGQDASVFFRSAGIGENNEIRFTVSQGMAAVGAISKRCMANLIDDPMFLTGEGVFGLDTYSKTQQKIAQPRSRYIDTALNKEQYKGTAFAVTHNGYYMLFINGHVYVADSRQRNTNPSGSFGYEWFYWTDVPATCGASIDGGLYVGDINGYVRQMKTMIDDSMEAYSDETSIADGEPVKSAIYSAWSTNMDVLSDSSSFKKVDKRNTGILTRPFAASSGDIYYLNDTDTPLVKSFSSTTVFDFDNVDFESFNFGELPRPMFIPCNRKVRKAKLFGIKVVNDKMDESFGVLEIHITYIAGNAIKN